MATEPPELETVILDACCSLNLYASGRMAVILGQLPYRFCIGRRARGEAQWVKTPDPDEREPVELQPLIEAGLLIEEALQGSQEEASFVELAVVLADGEAEAAALAASRGYILATDDRKARRIVTERGGAVRLSGTLELLREWQERNGVPDTETSEALHRIGERATYRPRHTHSLWAWWIELVGE